MRHFFTLNHIVLSHRTYLYLVACNTKFVTVIHLAVENRIIINIMLGDKYNNK